MGLEDKPRRRHREQIEASIKDSIKDIIWGRIQQGMKHRQKPAEQKPENSLQDRSRKHRRRTEEPHNPISPRLTPDLAPYPTPLGHAILLSPPKSPLSLPLPLRPPAQTTSNAPYRPHVLVSSSTESAGGEVSFYTPATETTMGTRSTFRGHGSRCGGEGVCMTRGTAGWGAEGAGGEGGE